MTVPGCWELGFPPLLLSDRERADSEAPQLEVGGGERWAQGFPPGNMALRGTERGKENSPWFSKSSLIILRFLGPAKQSSESSTSGFTSHFYFSLGLDSLKAELEMGEGGVWGWVLLR